MSIDLNTFGKTPAAHYLARLLTDIDDKSMTRACGVRVHYFSENVKGIVNALAEEKMSSKVAANMFRLLREEATKVELSYGFNDSKFVSQLLRNVIIGNIKSCIRKVTVIRKIENSNSSLNRIVKKGKITSQNTTYTYYSVLGYGAGTLYKAGAFYDENDSKIEKYYPSTLNINMISESITPELLAERSLKRSQRLGKDWAMQTFDFTEIMKVLPFKK